MYTHARRTMEELRLCDFLAGHVLREAMRRFEDTMGPWVKEEVKAYFCHKLKMAVDDDDLRLAEYAKLGQARQAEREMLVARRDELAQLIRSCPKEEKQLVSVQKLEVEAELKQFEAAPMPPKPVPRWIEECREFFGPTMKKHVNDSNRWDVHMIVVVMRALLRDVFAQHLPDHFHAKELLSGIIRVLSMRSTRAHRVAMVESDVLGALQQMVSVMGQCKRDVGVVAEVTRLLDDIKELVRRAHEEGDIVCEGVTLSAEDANAQRLYTSLTAWELHIEVAMGLVTVNDSGDVVDTCRGRLAYQNGTVVFGGSLEPSMTAVVQSLKLQLTVVAKARNWYFHNLPGSCDFAAVFAAMEITASAITAAAARQPWCPPPVAAGSVPTLLRLRTPSVRMNVPVARVDEIVGRRETVERITGVLIPGARVLLHGLPGVGKDTVMAEVAHRSEIHSLGGLQAWLQASSDVVLRRQLVDLFATHRPLVVAGKENNAAAAIAAIKEWLANNEDWVMFVEDASVASKTLWDVLSDASDGGRVLVTTQEVGVAASIPIFEAGSVFEIEPITTDESIELLIKSNVLSRKAPAPPDGETEAELEQRCIAAGAADVYVAPAPEGEKAKDRTQRCKAIEARLFERTELGRPEMRTFLEDTLGNLPLSVAQVGHMLRSDTRLSGVLDLIALFRQTADLEEVDRAGANPMLDKHYYGLSLSVRISLERLRDTDVLPEVDRKGALALLAILSLLDRAETPMSLLSGHDARGVIAHSCDTCRAAQASLWSRMRTAFAPRKQECIECRQRDMVSTLLSDASSLERAQQVCVQHGLLQYADEGSDGLVGVMHQLMQRCVRHELVTISTVGKVAVDAARGVLLTRFVYKNKQGIHVPYSQWSALRRLEPCVQAWADRICGENVEVASVEADGDLLSNWGFVLATDGDARASISAFERAMAIYRKVLPADHDKIATMLDNLGTKYVNLSLFVDSDGLFWE